MTTTGRRLVRNAAVCRRCGAYLMSWQSHEFHRCRCGAVAVHGGLESLWPGNPAGIALDLCRYEGDEGTQWSIARRADLLTDGEPAVVDAEKHYAVLRRLRAVTKQLNDLGADNGAGMILVLHECHAAHDTASRAREDGFWKWATLMGERDPR